MPARKVTAKSKPKKAALRFTDAEMDVLASKVAALAPNGETINYIADALICDERLNKKAAAAIVKKFLTTANKKKLIAKVVDETVAARWFYDAIADDVGEEVEKLFRKMKLTVNVEG